MEFTFWSLTGFLAALLLTLGLKALDPHLHWKKVMVLGYTLAFLAVLFSILVFTGWTTRGGWLLGCALGWLFGGLWVDDMLWWIHHRGNGGRSSPDSGTG